MSILTFHIDLSNWIIKWPILNPKSDLIFLINQGKLAW